MMRLITITLIIESILMANYIFNLNIRQISFDYYLLLMIIMMTMFIIK